MVSRTRTSDSTFLINHGDLEGGNDGVLFGGALNSVLNEPDGLISGLVNGMEVGGTATTLGIGTLNLGSIVGGNVGFDFDSFCEASILTNRGSIFGWNVGLADESSSVGFDTITNSGTIEGLSDGILIATAAGLVTAVDNSGTVQGGTASISTGSNVGALRLVNTGTLLGDVALADQADRILNSGHIAGTVRLGGGNDTFNGTGGTSGAIYGEAGNDHLTGGSQGDALHGGTGNDTLTGGHGADKFYFDTALNAATNVDHITDFTPAQGDKIVLSKTDFAGIGPVGHPLAAADFHIGPAVTPSQHIIYNPGNGMLFYDSNGNAPGGVTPFATLDTHPAILNTDFIVIA